MALRIKILLIDDEEDILEFLSYNLIQEGYEVETATDGEQGLEKVINFNPHLILVDVMMPNMDGIEFCEKLRMKEQNKDVMVAFLSARSEAFTQISALDGGADDYITKPIKPNVLKSRIKALLRRHPSLKEEHNSQILEFGNLKINVEQYKVYFNDIEISLAKKEFELLTLLASKPGKVFGRNEILNTVWGEDVIVGSRTIDVHIRKLREKLGEEFIYTYKGVGYKFESNP